MSRQDSTTVVRAQCIVLALIVAGLGRALHAGTAASFGEHAGHVVLDAVPVLPLALAAVLAGRLARRRRAAMGPLVTAAVLAAGLVPGSAVHGMLAQAAHAHAAEHTAWSALIAVRDAIPMFFAALAVSLFVSRSSGWNGPVRASRTPRMRRGRAGVALAALAAILPARVPVAAAVVPFSMPLVIPAELTGDDIAIEMREADVQVVSGTPTKMWTYNGTFPGPTIRRPSGSPTRVTFTNNLPAGVGSTTVHHHGNHSAASEDGHPHAYLIEPGGSRTYTYDFMEDGAPERAAFQWYHDHRMDVTGRNVWMGLAGMVILDDPVDAALPLPKGAFDVPLMIADRSLGSDNQLAYSFDPSGIRGTTILVNGVAQPYFDVAGAKYRLRLLNASNTTEFTFGFQDSTPMQQIATESGLLPAPVTRSRITLGPAERAEVVVDFSGRAGQNLVLRNTSGFGSLRDVMQFRIGPDVTDTSEVPSILRPEPVVPEPPVEATRLWALTQSVEGELVWTINGQAYDPDRIDTAPLHPRLNTAERWIFVNTTPVNHLMHIHDVDWRLVRRISPDPYPADAWLAEQGLKETFLVRPNEVVEIVSRFTDHLGVYVFHCHVLEHEDRAMMAQFRVDP